MTKQAVIKQGGPFIEVSSDGKTPLPANVVAYLEGPLTYTVYIKKYGQAKYNDVSGDRQDFGSEFRRMFQHDDHGRFVAQKGFRPKVTSILEEHGYQVELRLVDPPKATEIYTPNWDLVFEKFDFRPRQDECLAQVDMHDYGVIDAVTAFGKMYIIAMICVLYPKAKIDIVTKRKDVVKSLQRLVLRYCANVGRVGGGGRHQKSRITIYTADSLHHSDFDADIVLADEVHELMTDRYAELLSRYWAARMFGFTATKETRMDNHHNRMEGLFGPTIFFMNYPEAQELKLVVPINVQWLDIELDSNPVRGITDTVAKKRHGIWRNEWRNQIIAATANNYWQAGHQVLILVDTVDHLLHLKKFLPDFAACYSEQALADEQKRLKYIRWKLLDPCEPMMTAQRRDELRRAFEAQQIRGAIATGVWSVGVSFDSLQVLVRADGGASETVNVQTPGRVCRTADEKECGILIDCMDSFDPGFRDKSLGRRRAYEKNGWKQFLANGKPYEFRSRKRQRRQTAS